MANKSAGLLTSLVVTGMLQLAGCATGPGYDRGGSSPAAGHTRVVVELEVGRVQERP